MFGSGVSASKNKTPDIMYIIFGFFISCSKTSSPIAPSDAALVTIIPVAVDIKSAGI